MLTRSRRIPPCVVISKNKRAVRNDRMRFYRCEPSILHVIKDDHEIVFCVTFD